MLARVSYLTAAVALLSATAMGAAVEQRGTNSVDIAGNPYAACQCPNNCHHHEGSSCKTHDPNNSGIIYSGTCEPMADGLYCVQN